MSKAEEFAYSKYPKDKEGVLYDLARNSIIQGYHQAEKDFEEPVSEDLEEAAIDYATKEAAKDIRGIWTTTDILNAFKAGAEWQRNNMELKDYTTEELKAEIRRRWLLEQEEKKKVQRCRNCVHCYQHPSGFKMYLCNARTHGKKIVRNYVVSLSNKACELYEEKPKEESV